MSEPTRQLEEVLGELHEALESSSDLDDESRVALRSAVDEIRGHLEADSAAGDDIVSAVRRRLAEAVERFEDRHPRLTELVGRVADSLSELGI